MPSTAYGSASVGIELRGERRFPLGGGECAIAVARMVDRLQTMDRGQARMRARKFRVERDRLFEFGDRLREARAFASVENAGRLQIQRVRFGIGRQHRHQPLLLFAGKHAFSCSAIARAMRSCNSNTSDRSPS